MSENKSKYIQSIIEFIKTSGKSQKDIAVELNVSQSTISSLVNGERDPKLSTVIGLADLFGISIDTLAGYEPDTPVITESEKRLADRVRYLQQTIHGTVASFKDWTPKDVADYVWQQLFIALSYDDLCKEEDDVLVVDSWSPDTVVGRVVKRQGYRYGVPVAEEVNEDSEE